MTEIETNDYNLNITRYISTALPEEKIDLTQVNQDLHAIETKIETAKNRHNQFLQELGLPPLP